MTLSVKAVVVAEDIRKEITGKDIIIGAYGGDIVVPQFPAPVEIALWLALEDVEHFPPKWQLQMYLPNETTEPLRLDFEGHGELIGETSVATPRVGTTVTHAGELRVTMTMQGTDDPAEIVRKKIRTP